MVLAATSPSAAADCAPEPVGEGRVQAAIDARTLRLDDGSEVRLAGLAALRGDAEQAAQRALATIAVGRLVSLNSETPQRDRYGRLRAWVFAAEAEAPLQQMLIESGHGLRDIAIAEPACRAALETAEPKARGRRLGLWAAPEAIKKAETGDDISGEIGHFTVVGGRVLSVREAGGWTYLNFSRRWRDGFAAIVPKSALAAFEKAGLSLKGFEGQEVRIRGFIEKRGGARIEMTSPDQIEMAGKDAVATMGTRD
jgi:endonuclease YncB( thermonuclease family)